MNKTIKKMLSFMLALIMVIGIMPLEAFAFDNTGWLWPVPSSTIMSRGYFTGHEAIDILPSGKEYYDTEIYAAKAGTVYKVYTGCTNFSGYGSGITCQSRGLCNPNAGYFEGYCNGGVGNGVIINHGGGVMSEYAHMSIVNTGIYVGGSVNKGTHLGYMGSYGMSTGAHLHFSIKENIWSGSYWNGTSVNNNPYGDHYIVKGSWNGVDNVYYDTTGYGGVPAEVSVDWALDTSNENWFIGENNACIVARGYVSNESTSNVTEIGCYLYDENGIYVSHATENTTGLYQGSTDNVLMWYNMTTELGAVLEPGTNYKVMFYLVLSGVQYNSPHFDFTTSGSKTYTVTYDANGGYDAPAPQTKKAGETITLSSQVPIYDGYIFNGWTTDPTSEYGQYLPGFTYSEDADIYLYAAWSPAEVIPESTITITYDANGGYNAPAPQSYNWGEEFTITGEAPSHDEFTFIGWSLSPQAQQADFWREYTFAADEYYGDEITLYAVWACEIEIEYDANGGEGAPENGKVWTNHQTYAPQAPTRSGYEFVAWQGEIFYIDNGETLSFYEIYNEGEMIYTGRAGENEKIVLKAVWKKIGDTWADFSFNTATAGPGKYARLELVISNNDGTDASWWALDYPYYNSGYFELINVENYEIEGDGVIACFDFRITEDATEGAYAFSLDIVNSYNDAGELRVYNDIIGTVIIDNSSEGYIPVDPPVDVESFRVSFDMNGGEGGPEDFDAPLANDPYAVYAIVDLPEEIPTREGYAFIGWQEITDGYVSGAYKAGESGFNIWSDVVFKAVWHKDGTPMPVITAESINVFPGETGTIKFYIENNNSILINGINSIGINDDSYGGHWDFSSLPTSEDTNYSEILEGDGLIYEMSFDVKEDAAPAEYSFVVTFADGYSVDGETCIFMDIPFTVTVEEKADVKTYTVTFDAQGGEGGPTTAIKYEGVDMIIPSEVPVKEGYKFISWQFSDPFDEYSGYERQPGETYEFDADITMYAVWAKEICNITFIGEAVPENYQVEGGTTITLPELSREGYNFLGWECREETFTEGRPSLEFQAGMKIRILNDWEFTAVWEKIDTSDPDNIDLTVTSETLVIGSDTTVSVNIEGGSKAVAMQFAVAYDTEKLVLESCVAGEAMASLNPTFNTGIPGIIIFAWEGLEPFTAEGPIMDITFSAAPGTEVCETEVSIITGSDEYEIIFANENYEEIGLNIYNGVVEIIDVIYGDVTGDGKVNVLDANLTRRYAAKLTELDTKQFKAADVTGDGKVNVLDANLIRRYSAKLISIFPVEE